MRYSIEKCPFFHDERGDIIQFVTRQMLKKNRLEFGQIYIVTFDGKNVVRGNHFHNHSMEIFFVMSGVVEIVLEDVRTKERFQQVFDASKSEFFRITLSEKIAHAIRSISDYAMVIGFSSKEYNPQEDDKISYKLI
ncbi:MAG TPA: WxcM-like domain-containing protein [Chitinophagales bacterium]|nr:WxcM-like domain-containing protein [Chitinophagales bacterium]